MVNVTGLQYLDSYRMFPAPKIGGQAHSNNGDAEFGYLATSFHLTGYEPKLSDKMIPADDDATPINDPDHDSISDFSKTAHDNTGWFGVPALCQTSVSQVSRGDIALQKESKESLTRETEGKQRMRWDRDSSVISVGETMSRRSRRSSMRKPFSSDSKKILF